MATQATKPRVLLTNDDGPPGPESPYIYGLWKHLSHDLGWDVKVVVPSSQKSWIGKAYQIKDVVRGKYYYPTEPNGNGEVCETSRPLREGEVSEWVLLDGTPATCTNIALHNLYKGEIDLVISGPNLGRNTSSAFMLSSGTVGAALSGALSLVRAVGVSYGTMRTPVTPDLHLPAHTLSARIIQHLWMNWDKDEAGLRPSREVDLYSINVPMIKGLLDPESIPVRYTTVWRNSYQRLFKPVEEASKKDVKKSGEGAGPDAPQAHEGSNESAQNKQEPQVERGLAFRWGPEMRGLLSPSGVPAGTDAHTLDQGMASVTPLRAGFAEPTFTREPLRAEEEDRTLKIKL